MNVMFKSLPGRGILLGLVFTIALPAYARTIHADNALTSSCLTNYNVTTRSCGSGSGTAYRTLTEAVAALQAGDTLLVRGGNYSERLAPPRSGEQSAYIAIRAYTGETASITGNLDLAIVLTGRSYLIIEGFRIDNVIGWGRLEDSSNNIIRNNHFTRATAGGTTGGLKLVRSTYNRILDNTFEDGNDNVVVQDSDRNLLQNNIFLGARHSLLSVRCGNFNVIRGNTFSNSEQKAAEIYDCEGVSDAPVKLDATKRNIFDANRFILTRASSEPHRYNGIQYGGQNSIVRRNVFHDNQGGAIRIQVYSDEALYNYGHRFYHNTFYNNRCYGLSSSDVAASSQFRDNRARNNLFYRNTDCSGGGAQISFNTTAVIFENNALLTSAPPFVDEAGRNLRLQPGSAQIDAGAFLASAVGAGSGTRLVVDDPSYFYDGYGIPAETGDLIQLAGQSQTARIVAIDYAARVLTLSQSLAWTDGQGVHLAYSGSRPDMGAFEFETGSASNTPSPPTNLTATRL